MPKTCHSSAMNRSDLARKAANARWGGDVTIPVELRFARKVDRRKPDECWLWLGARNPKGYGVFSIWGDSTRHAHRHAWQFHHKRKIKKGMDCAHTCHNRLCVNPAHLVEATRSQNMLHSAAEGRLPCQINPEKTNLRKLKRSQVHRIRELKPVRTVTQLANLFGVTKETIRNIHNRTTWTHI